MWKGVKLLTSSKNDKADLTEQLNDVKDMNKYFVNCIQSKNNITHINDFYESNRIFKDNFHFTLLTEYRVSDILAFMRNISSDVLSDGVSSLKMCVCPFMLTFIVNMVHPILLT